MAVAKVERKFDLKPKHIRLIDKVIAQIKAHPDNVNMNTWFTPDTDITSFQEVERMPPKKLFNCGTTCCIAGHTLVAARYPLKTYILGSEKKGLKYRGEIGDVAAKLLGLVDENYDSYSEEHSYAEDPWNFVFLHSYWPEELRQEYNDATTPKQQAKVMVKRLQYLKKYGA